jgi:hypothetical protein
MRYLPQGTPPEDHSQPSQPSQLSYDLQIQLDRVAANEPAEKCECCGEFPVAYTFTYNGQQLRRCKNCIDSMQSKGLKFTTLRKVNDEKLEQALGHRPPKMESEA